MVRAVQEVVGVTGLASQAKSALARQAMAALAVRVAMAVPVAKVAGAAMFS